jgi:hypothetical protein
VNQNRLVGNPMELGKDGRADRKQTFSPNIAGTLEPRHDPNSVALSPDERSC